MQNKGFVRFFAISLALVCLFYLSFTFVTNYWDKQAKEIAQGDSQKYYEYLEEISGEEKWLGFTLKECHEKEINLVNNFHYIPFQEIILDVTTFGGNGI